MDLAIDADGNLKQSEVDLSKLVARMLRPPVRQRRLVSPREYARLKGSTYPAPFQYLASWSLTRHYASFPPVTAETWAGIAASLDAQRGKPTSWPRWDGALP